MIEYDGETYLTANEIAQRLNISWGTCRANVLQQMQQCYLPGRKRAMYKQSDVDQFAEVRIVHQTSYSVSPAPSTTDQAGGTVTRTSTLLQSELDWQPQYSLPGRSTQPVHA